MNNSFGDSNGELRHVVIFGYDLSVELRVLNMFRIDLMDNSTGIKVYHRHEDIG